MLKLAFDSFLGVCTWPWFKKDGLCVHGWAQRKLAFFWDATAGARRALWGCSASSGGELWPPYSSLNLTKSNIFALPFCGHRWVENLPLAERALTIWPNIKKYVKAVLTKQFPHPGKSSFDTIAAASGDPLIPAKLHFFMAISRSVTPFLTRYQTDEPVLPFIMNDLADLLKVSLNFLLHCEYDF